MEAWKKLVATCALQGLSKHRGKAREKLDYYRATKGIDVHLILIFDFKNKWPYTGYDIDNLEKNVLDALEGVLYVNDKQVCHVVKSTNYYDGEIMMGLKVEITYWERAKHGKALEELRKKDPYFGTGIRPFTKTIRTKDD